MIARHIAKHQANSSGYHAGSRPRLKPSHWRSLHALVLSWLLVASACPLPAAEEYSLRTVVDDLRWPWSVAALPEGGFLISEREGHLVHVQRNGQRSVLANTPATLFAGQGGYFDVVLHPNFESNRFIYLSYAEGTEKANTTAVFRAVFRDGSLHEGRRILRVEPEKGTPQHYGGRLMFLANGSFFLTTGEGFEYREQAQSLDSELGKVLHFTEDGEGIGAVTTKQGEPTRIWTYGHRNPQGLTYNPASGMIYLHEHGPRGGDELNLVQPGNNYGWPAVTHGVDYSGAYVSPFTTAPGMKDPLWTWVPSIAPSGIAWYDGEDFPQWRQSLFIGALVNREVRRLEISEGRVVKEEALFGELNERIRDVRVFKGKLFLLTDGEQGKLIQVMPR